MKFLLYRFLKSFKPWISEDKFPYRWVRWQLDPVQEGLAQVHDGQMTRFLYSSKLCLRLMIKSNASYQFR